MAGLRRANSITALIALFGLGVVLCASPTSVVAEELDELAGTVESVAEPVADVAEPILEPVADAAEPISEPITQPEVEPVASAAEIAEPVTRAADPVVENAAPHSESEPEPVVAGASDQVTPLNEPAITDVTPPESAVSADDDALGTPRNDDGLMTGALAKAAVDADSAQVGDVLGEADAGLDEIDILDDPGAILSDTDQRHISEVVGRHDKTDLVGDVPLTLDEPAWRLVKSAPAPAAFDPVLPVVGIVRAEAVEPVADGTLDAFDPQASPTIEPVVPLSELASPRPDVETAAPVFEPVNPILTSTAPILEPVVEPGMSTATPMIEPVAPMLSPITPTLQQGIESVRPFANLASPVVEPVSPILTPITPSVMSVLDPVTPVFEPVTHVLQPVVEPTAPIITPVEPDVEPTAPILEPISLWLPAIVPVREARPVIRLMPSLNAPVLASDTLISPDLRVAPATLGFSSTTPSTLRDVQRAPAVTNATSTVEIARGADRKAPAPGVNTTAAKRAPASVWVNRGALLPSGHGRAVTPANTSVPGAPAAPAPGAGGLSSSPAAVASSFGFDAPTGQRAWYGLLVHVPSSISQSVTVPPG